MTGGGARRRYVHTAHVEQLAARLSARDWAILESVGRCRVLSGSQLERLHFFSLSPHTRSRTRRLVLSRLASGGVIAPLERRIGGINGGSSGLVFSLDTAGRRLMRLRFPDEYEIANRRNRRPWTPGQIFLAHSLQTAELYVALTELSREAPFRLANFQAEPHAWWPDGLGGWLKPDAYLLLQSPTGRTHVWVEIDRATESLPTLRRKLLVYLDFLHRGQLGPNGVMPLVAVVVPDARRLAAVTSVVVRLPEPATQLFVLATGPEAGGRLAALAGSAQNTEGGP